MKISKILTALVLGLVLVGSSALAGTSLSLIQGEDFGLFESRPQGSSPENSYLGLKVISGDYAYFTAGNYEFESATDLGNSIKLVFNQTGSTLTKTAHAIAVIDKSLLVPGTKGSIRVEAELIRWTESGAQTKRFAGSVSGVSTQYISELSRFVK